MSRYCSLPLCGICRALGALASCKDCEELNKPKSKIEEAFPANGRKLFESERAEVEAFNEKYRKHFSNLPSVRATVKASRLSKGIGTQEFFHRDYIIYR